jgi:hypothetical protein
VYGARSPRPYSPLSGVVQDPVRKKYTGHTKGVYSFDYCQAYKVMVSCGSSRRISVWDPFRCREVNSLAGHAAAVQQVRKKIAKNEKFPNNSKKLKEIMFEN